MFGSVSKFLAKIVIQSNSLNNQGLNRFIIGLNNGNLAFVRNDLATFSNLVCYPLSYTDLLNLHL